MPTDAAAFLADLDDLAYPRRMAALAARARALVGTAELDDLLGQLAGGDFGQRRDGLFMAVVSGHRGSIEAAALGDDLWLRTHAVSVWIAGSVDSDTVLSLIADGSADIRRQVYATLRTGRRPDLAAAIIGAVRDRFGDQEAAAILPACPPDMVTVLLPELAHAVVNWSALSTRHPEAVIAEALRSLAPLSTLARERWWNRYGLGVWAAATRSPAAAFELVEQFAPATSMPGNLSQYGPLLRLDAGRLLRMLTTPGRAGWLASAWLSRPILRHFAALPTTELAPLARRLRSHPRAFAALLHAIAPHRREELFDAAFAGVDISRAIIADPVLEELPHACRSREARRILALVEVRDDEGRVLHYTAFLPWADASKPLIAATRRALAEDRGLAYELLIRCAARSRDTGAANAALDYVVRVRNEQDPVRALVLGELARTGVALLDAASITALEHLVTDALEARDASLQTRQAVSTLALNVLREHVDDRELIGWSTRTLQRVFGDGRLPWLGDLSRRLRHGQEHEFFAAVRDWISAAIRRGDHGPLFAVARALGRRGWDIVGLQDMLESSINRGNTTSVVRDAIDLWLKPRTPRDERVAEVVDFDASSATLSPVWSVLCTRRIDLLDVILGERAPTGIFLSDGPRWVPSYGLCPERWRDRHRRRYTELLARVIADDGAVMSHRTSAIRGAAPIPVYGWSTVAPWLDSPETNLSEAALGALVWTDRPADALPLLLAHVDDDRARVAAYAVGRTARFIAPSRLGEVLTGAALQHGKVTVRKELIRLIAALGVPDAGALLLAQWCRDGQHRDVRAAIVSAVRQRPGLPHAWTILTEAAASGREDSLAVLAAEPFDFEPDGRLRYAGLVGRCASSADDVVATEAWRVIPKWAQWAPDPTDALVARITDVRDHQVWRQALEALTAFIDADNRTDALVSTLTRLIALDRADDTTEPEFDRAAWHRIDHVAAHLINWSRRKALDADRSALVEASAVLATHDPCRPQSAALRVESVTLTDPGLASALGSFAALIGDRFTVADQRRTDLTDLVARDTRWQPEHLIATAYTLAEAEDRSGGLFAVALATGGSRSGWAAPWRDLVTELRRHPTPDVRDAALRLTFAAAR